MALSSPQLLILSMIAIVVRGDKIDIGANYGFNGDNLPSPKDTVNAYKRYGIGKMRLFEPRPDMLEALRGSDIDLTLGVRNQDMPTVGSSVASAEQWFIANVEPYVNDITIPYITVGNEVIPGEFSESILPAMQNLQTVLNNRGLAGMRTTTVLSLQVLASTYPPSAGVFTDAAKPFMGPILEFLSAHGAPLMVNVYPYFAYASDPDHIPLAYAQFTASEPVVQDQGLSYTNLFDAMADSFVWAMEKSGVADVEIVVSESGWPHDGNGQFTTVDLAKTYNQNFMKHILSKGGTPKRPGAYIEGFIFAMVDENLKPAGVEQHFGMFKPSLEPIYNIFS